MTGRFSLILCLMLLVMFSPLGIDIYLPAMPEMSSLFNTSNAAIQQTLTLFMFALGFGQLIFGPLTDRWGRKPVVLTGILLYGLSSLACQWLVTLEQLYLVRILQGLGACSASVVAFAIVRDCYTPKQGASIYSYLNGALCTVPALAPVLGGLLTMNYSWRANFVFMALFALVVMLLVLSFLKETKPEATQSPSFSNLVPQYFEIIKQSQFFFHALISMCGMGVILTYVSFAPMVLIEQLDLSEIEFGYWFGGIGAINIVVFLLTPQVIKHWGKKFSLNIGLSFISAGGILALLSTLSESYSALSYMGPAAVISIGFSLSLGPASAFALAPFGQNAGTASGLLGAIQMAGASSLMAVMHLTGLSGGMALGTVSVVTTSLLLVFMGPVHRRLEARKISLQSA